MKIAITICIIASILGAVSAASCLNPAPAKNFSIEAFTGTWYEIGKIQTAGGAFFERNCVCTTVGIAPINGSATDFATVNNTCRNKQPDGKHITEMATLKKTEQTEVYDEYIGWYAPASKYIVPIFGGDYAVEYDCTVNFWIFENYCIHVLSRTPTLDYGLVQDLLQEAENLGLNQKNLVFKPTLQDGCWN